MSWTDDYLREYGRAVVKFGPSASLVYDFDTNTFSKKEAEGMKDWASRGMDESYREKYLTPPKKKEANMKTDKMSQETIAALHKSIAHWNDICYGDCNDTGRSHCAMCTLFGRCSECPLKPDGGCEDDVSKYSKFIRVAEYHSYFCTVDSAEAAEAMLELLVSLLPRIPAYENTGQYEAWCAAPELWRTHHSVRVGDWYFNGNDEIYRPTGITTDGRNAFPQAKYVWEKVFAGQKRDRLRKAFRAKEKGRDIGRECVVYDNYRFAIPLRAVVVEEGKDDRICLRLITSNNPRYPVGSATTWVHRQQVAFDPVFTEQLEVPANYYEKVYASGLKVRDGKCVTCGQVVKKKVVKVITKYQVLYRSTCEGKDLGISANHYTNAGEFYSNTSGLTYIRMLSESAKEFDV